MRREEINRLVDEAAHREIIEILDRAMEQRARELLEDLFND